MRMPTRSRAEARALLLEIAWADGEFSAPERTHLEGVLARHFNLSPEEGARLMAAAGYDPRDMASFFSSLEERGGERAPEAEDDHPNPASRVALIEEALPSLQTGRAPVRDTEEFRRIQARLSGRR